MLRQTDDFLNPLGKWGCYVVSILNMAELINPDRHLTQQNAFALTANAWKAGWIDDKFDIQNPEAIARSAGAPVKFIGKADAFYRTKANEYEILEFYNARTKFTHFALGDGTGKVLFDPIKDSVTVREGRVVGKRIFRKEL